MTISLADQISCVKRELAMRRNVYGKWVRGGRMEQDKADKEIAGMEAVLATLEGLKAAEAPGLPLDAQHA